MNIGIDMMGGDFAPIQAVEGIKQYLAAGNSNTTLFCIGDQVQINNLIEENKLQTTQIVVIDAPEVIGMNEHPTKASKEKPQSSIVVGFQMLALGKIDAFLSAGNTGAMLVGAMYSIKAIKGILRPAIASFFPKLKGGTGILLDVGLNADCKPEYLSQFAVLGSLYAKHISGTENPTVGLLNVGEEEGKGNILALATYPLLKENKRINFVGNVEGRDLFLDKADVIVCEGFTGNVVLKMAESIYEIAEQRAIKDQYLDSFQYENYGGSPVLGLNKPVIIGHGISKGKAFCNMILLAEKMVESNICGEMVNSFTSDT